ncbi:fatty-acyl-CoA synthase [Sulfitobacter dubius]|nr:fatty-acyl-CoA synthase [Sulfitobacter dubius]
MKSTMQRGDLGVARALRHAIKTGADTPVTYQSSTGAIFDSLRSCAERAARLGLALRSFGLAPGTRVATFCGTTREHFEAFLGVPAYGFVLHPLNIRMSDEDLARIVAETKDEVLILDSELAERFATLAPNLTSSDLRLILVTGNQDVSFVDLEHAQVLDYQQFFSDFKTPEPSDITDVPEDMAATICHTGGTTGRPKAVAYSHRSIWLQALNLCLADTLGLCRADRALLAVPFYHVNGWGLPYACVISGAGLVLPGSSFRPGVLCELINRASVTIAAGVPTIWTDLLGHLDAPETQLASGLKRIATGGAAVPVPLSRALAALDITPVQAWGMTETSSMSAIGPVEVATHSPIGRPVPGLELRTIDDKGVPLMPGASVPGEVQVRGPTVISHYLEAGAEAAAPDGWVSTGDIGTIDASGALTLTDRLKDAIKSGGEWIPAAALENAICEVSWVRDVAVIAQHDERFQERPFGVLVVSSPEAVDLAALRAHLQAVVPSWWIPKAWSILPALPRTTLGKPDKRELRERLIKGKLQSVHLTQAKNLKEPQS